MTPARLLESRAGEPVGTIDGAFEGVGLLAAGTTTELRVSGRGPVGQAVAVALNVTVTQPGAAGYVTVSPCGVRRPTASNLNFVAGQTVANAVTARIGTGGKVCIYTSASTHAVVDVNGYFA